MRRSIAVTGLITAGLTALALAAGPALAQGGSTNGPGNWGTTGCPFAGSSTGINGTAQGYGGMMGNGGGMMGNGSVSGYGAGAGMMGGTLAPMGTLTSAQQAVLVSMSQEEKLAHDVYVALAAKFPADYQFARIARSESMHQAALRALLVRYGITDVTAGLANGQFATDRFQNLYRDLLGQATTPANALDVGIAVEKLDIADLTAALNGLTAPDVTQVYTTLRNASEHHLAAFGG